MVIVKRIKFLSAILVCIGLASAVYAESGFLPGGTAVSIQIDAPIDGSEYSAPAARAGIPLNGVASIGNGSPDPDTSLIFLLDISGSAEDLAGSSLFCPDQNPIDNDPGDPVPDENEIIDCEIGAAVALNAQAARLGTVDEVAAIVFAGDAVAADATPDLIFAPFTHPNADADSSGKQDIVEVLQSIEVAFLFGQDSGFNSFHKRDTPDIVKTDYADALSRAQEIASMASNKNVIIVMVSDGINNAGNAIDSVLPIAIPGKNIVIHTFAIPDAYGFGGNCTADWDGRGSLQDIADLQNAATFTRDSKCHNVSDPGVLPTLLPEIILPTMTQLSYKINGGPELVFSPADLTLSLPQDGPVDVAFSTHLTDLPLGTNELCVYMSGIDAGGSGRVSDCVTINIVMPFEIPDQLGRRCDERHYPLVKIAGQGLRDVTLPFSHPTYDPSVKGIFSQATMKAEVRIPRPDSVTLSSSTERFDFTSPIHENGGYVYEAWFDPVPDITVDATGADFEALSLVNYLLFEDDSAVAQSTSLINQFVNRGTHEESISIETYDTPRDLHISMVLSDIDADDREVELRVTAGDVVQTAVLTTPNAGNGLAIYQTTLFDVPGDIERVELRLSSFRPNGDSVFWNSTIVTYPCPVADLGDATLPAHHQIFLPVAFAQK